MNPELQLRIAAIKAECEKVIELDKLATAGPWVVIEEEDGTVYNEDYRSIQAGPGHFGHKNGFGLNGFISGHDSAIMVKARNVSPAMARVVIATISHWEKVATVWSSESEMLAQIALEEIANQWEEK